MGDAGAWPEIWELNQGHTLSPGREFDDPNLILPGWELVVPDALVVAVPVVAVPVVAVPVVAVPVDVTPEAVPADPSSPVVTPVVATPMPATTAVPPITAISPTTAIPPKADVATETDSTPTTRPSAVSGGLDSSVQADSGPPLGGIGAAVLLASGLVGAVAVRRRRQLRSAAVNARLAEVPALMSEVADVLHRLDNGERVTRIDIALRAAAHEVASSSLAVSVLGVISAADGTLDLLLDGLAPAVSLPWIRVSDHRWRLPAHVGLGDLADSARQSQQPCPALAHIGSTPLDVGAVGELFLDLEAIGLLAIDAPAAAADSIVRAIAAGVAVSPLAEVAHIITAGLGGVTGGDPHLDHPSARSVETLAEALDSAVIAVGTTAMLAAGKLTTFALRGRQRNGEVWEPVAVLVGRSARLTDFIADSELLERAGEGGHGIAVVVAGAVSGGRWTIRIDGDHWVLAPLGLEITPIGIALEDVAQMQSLLDEADKPLLAPQDELNSDSQTTVPSQVPSATWMLMVRTLGRPEVSDLVGTVVDFERSKALELVVWLTQHRGRSTRGGARTALWEVDVRDTTFANVVSDARRSLARTVTPPTGEEWIGRTLTDELPLHPAVTTDAAWLADRMSAASGLEAAAAIEVIRPALALVRDIPFAGSNYLWPDSEGLTSELILLVTSAATVCAGHSLALGDIAGVFWATGQGLTVLPGHEELIALRMRAHGRQGDLAGVRLEWESYERVLNADTWSDGEPAPKLVALRRELLTPSLVSMR